MKKLIFIVSYLLLVVPCAAEIIIVDQQWPYDFNNIQAAIDYSSNGDFIIVFPGTYTGTGNRDIDFLGKTVTVQSIDPTDPYIVAATTIDCNGLGRGFCFHNAEGPNSLLDGLTIINGYGSDGGAIACNNSSPTITNCNITGNSAGEGAGIYCSSSSPSITNCAITGNSSLYQGGGVRCYYYSSPQITNCKIIANDARFGGAVSVGSNCGLVTAGSTIAGNSAELEGGGIHCEFDTNSTITSCILWDNTVEENYIGGQIATIGDIDEHIYLRISYCDLRGGLGEIDFDSGSFITWGPGNIAQNPQFVDDANDDYRLTMTSPCINAGDLGFVPAPGETDLDGNPRVYGLRVDMGAYEFQGDPNVDPIVVTKPQGSEVWVAASTHEIKWDNFTYSKTINISYSDNNGTDWTTIDSNLPDTGSYTWNLPNSVDSNQCLVLIHRTPDSNAQSCLFTIRPDSPGPPVVSIWKSLGGDFDRSGLSQFNGPELGCIKWQFQTAEPVSASPTIGAEGQIHLACEDGNLYTIDPNGQLLWTFDANSPLLSSPSIAPDGSLFVGAMNGKVYAIDPNGNLRWTHNTDGFIYSSPAISADGDIYVGSQDGKLYALAQDGSELWTFQTAGLGPGAISSAIFASPAIGLDGSVYISGLYKPKLYALDPNDGSIKWICNFSDFYEPNDWDPGIPTFWSFASPVVATDGTIYQALIYNTKQLIGSPPLWEEVPMPFWYDSRLYAIDPNNGQLIWSANMTETPKQNEESSPPEPNYLFKNYYTDALFPSPSYPHTHTYLAEDVNRYYRVSNSSWSEPALAPDGTIYINFNDQYLRAVDPNGTIKWVTSLGWLGNFTMTVGSNGLLYAASADGDLYVVDPNGKQLARFGGDGELTFPVINAGNSILICDSENTVWAITGSNCQGQTADLHRPEDLNADWSTNLVDFAVMADFWLECTDTSYDPVAGAPYCYDDDNQIFLLGDINRDQYIDSADLADLADRWLNQE